MSQFSILQHNKPILTAMKKHYLLFFLFTAFFANAQEPFITTWEVTADDLTIGISVFEDDDIPDSFTINFGNGTILSNLSGGATHTYETPGIYTVSMSGSFSRIVSDFFYADKLKTIEQWGDIQWTEMSGAFEQCVNMTITATDVPDLSNVENMISMFRDCHSFNQSINNWDVSNVTNMSGMFQRAYQFNQPLDNWDVSNVTNMSFMFYEAGEFNQPIDDWDVSSVTNMSLMFHGANLFNQPLNNWDVSNVTNMNRVFSSTEMFNQDLSNWDVSNVTNMEQMFWASLSFNGDISTWDVSNVTNMKEMFSGAESFNQPLNDWNVSSVINMVQMFGSATAFNQPINDWDVSNVTDMSGMFAYADAFNQPLNDWDVSSVTVMSGLFMSADVFNQPLNDWDTSAVTTMQNMFNLAIAFNQPLNNWNVSNVTNMSSMFDMAQAFDQSLNNWDVSNVTNTKKMFSNASSYNQPLNDWDVSAVSNMMEMFNSADLFNQPLDSWDISNVTDMKSMFGYASAFNQDISSWDFNSGVIFGAFGSNGFLSNSGMDTANYDALLLKFAELELEGKSFAANEVYYCNSAVHDYLENILDWNINDEGLGADCQGNSVIGNVLFDSDSNGCDVEDIAIDTFLVSASNGSFDYVTSVANGQYDLNVLEDTYTVQLLNLPDYFTAAPALSEITFEGFGNEETLNFCLTANETIADLNVTLLPLGEARPGFPAEYQLVMQNMGTQTVADATVTLTFDDTLFSFVEASPALASSATNQLTFEIENLQPLESVMIDIEMEVFAPPTVNGGEIANFTAAVTEEDDNTPTDNTFTLEQQIVNSYDPNDKRVLQGDEIYMDQADEYLDYIIRFQNTGTASAITVRIEDVLHENLDWTTLVPISASHDYRVEITDGNDVEFIFDNINLPHEEADEAGSNGFIAYKIKPIAGIQVGDVMEGNASIYFDYNLPIITNTATTEVVEETAGSETYMLRYLQVYPNPASDKLYLQIANDIKVKELIVYNMQGRKMLSFTGQSESFDISSLSTGVYMVEIKTDKGAAQYKLVKN